MPGTSALYPIGPDCFIEYKFYGEVCFARDDAGSVAHITWASPGVTSKWVEFVHVEEVGPGLISTPAIEDGVEILPDGSLIVSRRTGEWGAVPAKPSSLLLYRRNAGGWDEPEPLFPELPDVSDAAISPDGSRLVFIADQDVWLAARSGDRWMDPVRLGPEVNSPQMEMGAHFGPDGSLWFSSTRHGGLGSGDLWRAAFVDGRFEQARPIGAPINSRHGEWNVMVSRDGRYVIFEGSGRPTNLSPSGDLYISWREGDGWTAPRTLPAINTTGSDLMPRVSPDGQWLYFVSTGRNGSGQADIYRTPFPFPRMMVRPQ